MAHEVRDKCKGLGEKSAVVTEVRQLGPSAESHHIQKVILQ